MNIFKLLEIDIKAAIEALKQARALPPEANAERVEATPPKDPSHGDIATNAAMVLAAQLKVKPQEIAALLLESIKNFPQVAAADIAGAGFINMRLKPEVWQGIIPVILRAGTHFGDSELGKGQRVNVEYVSVNPTGPMHVGHARHIYGDALADLLIKSGYSVTKEYYINDAGAQVDKLADSVFLRYREACGEAIGEIPEGLYPGDYLVPVGEGLRGIHGTSLLDQPREAWLPVVRAFALAAMMDLIKSDLARLGIQHDVFTSEQAIRDAGKVDEAVRLLEAKGLIYTGVLEPPKGKPVPEDWEPRPQLLFRSTHFGDEADRAIKKSDGSWAYITPDIAYELDKIQRGYGKLVMLLGIDHGGYVKRLKAGVAALSDEKVELEIKLCNLVKFMRGGEPLKMSKRAGTFISVREVVEEVGKGVLRFIMLTRKSDVPLDFDFAKVMEQSKDNPVFYVQYAHARAHSVLRLAAAEMPEAAARALTPDAALLVHLAAPEELALIKLMAAFPRLIEQSATAGEPHRVAFYLQELAASFHGLWNRGNEQNALRFIQKDAIEVTAARLALARALATVIASGLMVLGVEPMEEMR